MKRDHEKDKYRQPDANRDPLTGETGAHPVGVGVGAAGAGTAGGVIGAAVGGPVGAAIGIAAGAVAGGYAGKAVAEKVDPTVEDTYWRNRFVSRPYVQTGETYLDYAPAYRYGWESCCEYGNEGKCFDDVEPELERDWERRRGTSKLSWDRAKNATRDAWHRVEAGLPGDADKDGI